MIIVFTAGPAAVIIALLILGAHWLDGDGDHTRRGIRRRERETAAGFTGGRDLTAHLPRPGRFPALVEDQADWWHAEPPPPAIEVITGPRTRIAQTSQLTMHVLGRVAASMPAPDDDPCDTGEMAALLARGHVTPAQEAGRLAAKHMPAPEVTP